MKPTDLLAERARLRAATDAILAITAQWERDATSDNTADVTLRAAAYQIRNTIIRHLREQP
jgi:hypothetical protein